MVGGAVKKPKAVVLVQIVATLSLGFSLFGIVRFLHSVAFAGVNLADARLGVMHFPLLCMVMALLALMLFAIYRQSWPGRLLGIVYLVLLGSPVYVFCLQMAIGPPLQRWQATGQVLAMVIYMTPLTYWIYAFGFSEKARRYFTPRGQFQPAQSSV